MHLAALRNCGACPGRLRRAVFMITQTRCYPTSQ